jgi:hypothetical protein
MPTQLLKNLANLPGWRTRRKIVVFESDDWGSIRMPSLRAYESLKTAGLNIASKGTQRYNTLDTLASATDLESLFETLSKHRDRNNRKAVFTAMALSANPDFEQVRAANFRAYHYEPVTQTLDRYGLENSWPLWQEGRVKGVFHPEFHGREHLNVNVWLKALRADEPHTLKAFEKQCWGFRPKLDSGISYQAAFDVDTPEILESQKAIVEDGIRLFEQLHGYAPQFFVPPNGAIHQDIIDHATSCGIAFVSSPKVHREPQGNGKHRRRFRWLGRKGKNGSTYLTRNCFFEPSYKGKGFSIADCLTHIKTAFQWNKPAIISTHRVNYIGGLQEVNRKQGNAALDALLSELLGRWPEVEFMTSTELGECIRNDQK